MNGPIALARVAVHTDRTVPVCSIDGEIDASNVDDVFACVVDAVPNDAPGLVLDLERTSYLDSGAVRMLFELSRRLRTHRQELRIAVPAEGIVRRVLVLTALADVVALEASVDPAVRALEVRR